MRIKMVKSIFKKELIDILRDKKTLFMGIVLPLILYPIMMILVTQIMTISMSSMDSIDLNIAFEQNAKKELTHIIKNYENKENENINIIETNDYKKDLEDDKIDAYISFTRKNKVEDYKIYMNSSKENYNTVSNKIDEIFEAYKKDKVENKIKEAKLNVDQTLNPVTYSTIDVAKTEEVAGSLLGQILPFVLVMGVLLGAIYPAIDSMAGEKERGTLETLFTLPITNLELVMGKYIAVSLCAIVTAILNVVSILLTMSYILLTGQEAGNMIFSGFKLSSLAGPLFITMICICLFAMVVSAISMCVCSLAKSFKDAQNYITPVMFLVLIPSYVSMIPNISLDRTTSIIPVVNISLLIKSLLSGNANLGITALVFISNFAFVILSVVLLSKMFNSEEILFGNGRSFSFLEKRSNIKKGTMPTVSDGIILYALGLVLLIYVGGYVQLKYKMTGIALTQIMIIALPLLFALYIKGNFKEIFSFKLPKIKYIIASVLLWVGVYFLVMLLSNIILYYFPQNQEIVKGLNEALFMKDNLLLNVLVVAGMPAICEEIFFRGFILTSFKNKKKSYVGAIIFSGILFGMMHMDFVRIIPTSILGISFAYAVCKTNSIFVSMLMHFLNNGFAVVVSHITSKQFENLDSSSVTSLSLNQIIVFLAISLIFISISVFIFEKNNKGVKSVN